jgi:hypothetical protein
MSQENVEAVRQAMGTFARQPSSMHIGGGRAAMRERRPRDGSSGQHRLVPRLQHRHRRPGLRRGRLAGSPALGRRRPGRRDTAGAMSQENIEALQRAAEANNRQDYEAFLEGFDRTSSGTGSSG